MEAKARVYNEIREMQQEARKGARARQAAALVAAAGVAIVAWEVVLRSLVAG